MAQNKLTQPSVEDLTEQMEILRSDISNLARTMADVTKAKGAEVGRAASDQARYAKQKGEEAVDVVTHQAREAQAYATDMVRSQPATALGIAAGLGFLIGMLNSRK